MAVAEALIRERLAQSSADTSFFPPPPTTSPLLYPVSPIYQVEAPPEASYLSHFSTRLLQGTNPFSSQGHPSSTCLSKYSHVANIDFLPFLIPVEKNIEFSVVMTL
jgi:hypothetical protein